jgi:hypothetical protein
MEIGTWRRIRRKFACSSGTFSCHLNLYTIKRLTYTLCVEFASEDCDFLRFDSYDGDDAQAMYATDCADTSIIRTPSRQELLYTRSQIVVAAKTFGLDAIDMAGDEPMSRSSDIL